MVRAKRFTCALPDYHALQRRERSTQLEVVATIPSEGAAFVLHVQGLQSSSSCIHTGVPCPLPRCPLISWVLPTLLHHLPALLTGQPADDPDRLMDTGRVAKTQPRVVFALEHFVVLDQGLA